MLLQIAKEKPASRLLDRRFVALADRLHCDPSERRVHLLSHTLLLSANSLQIATGGFQVRVPEPQLNGPDVHTSQQMHASECMPELVKVELLTNCVRFAGHRLSEVSRVAMAAVQFATLRHFLEIAEQMAIRVTFAIREDPEQLAGGLQCFQIAHEARRNRDGALLRILWFETHRWFCLHRESASD